MGGAAQVSEDEDVGVAVDAAPGGQLVGAKDATTRSHSHASARAPAAAHGQARNGNWRQKRE